MNRLSWVQEMNTLGSKRIPFLFILDFECHKPKIYPLDRVPDTVFYKCNQIKNYEVKGQRSKPLLFEKKPINIDVFKKGFDQIMHEILIGNSFLLNLTYPTDIKTNYTLKEMFNASHAKYKLYYRDRFIVSSPEIFVQIIDGKIYTFPMKGTINADIPNAQEIILSDTKETAEHYTIVDLLRNDISQVASNVTVTKFRYIDLLETHEKRLLQVSSEIVGDMTPDYHHHLGTIFEKLLPAGSISGAPKKKTIDIIKSAEMDDRGYYTGIFGIFDGANVDSGVMIRYIEKQGNNFKYRSGCGITAMSNMEMEYQELLDKVYLPIHSI